MALPPTMWMGVLTTAHPSLLLEVRDRLPLRGGRTLFDIRLESDEPIDWGEEIRTLPRVHRVELIERSVAGPRFRVESDGPTFLPLARRLAILRSLPFPIRNGVATWTVVGPKVRLRRLWSALASSRTPFELEAVRPAARGGPPAKLTPRQAQVLRRAISEGYFEVPRKISLSALAARMGVATSTLSVMLALVEKRIVEAHPAALGVA